MRRIFGPVPIWDFALSLIGWRPVHPIRLSPALTFVLSLLALVACDNPGSARLRPVARLGGEGGEVSAAIGDETRDVFSGISRAPLVIGLSYVVPAQGDLVVPRVLPPRLAAASKVVVTARASVDDRSWIEIPPTIASVRSRGARRSIEMRLAIPEAWRGREVKVHAIGWAPPTGRRRRQRSEPMVIPRGAVLELGGGVLEPGIDRGGVEFAVSACLGQDCRGLLRKRVDDDSREWDDWRIDLADYAGKSVEFLFETEFVDESSIEPLFAVWSRPLLLVPGAADLAQPNVILLSIDTLRADHLTSYGYVRDTAPKLRLWFEEQGVMFENVVAAATTTGPSHMTMLTSVTPTVHGIARRPGVGRPAPITLAERMRLRGYATAAVTEDGPLHAGWGFSRGFDSYAENKSADVMLPEGHVVATFDKAEKWLRRNTDRPFFLFVHTFEVHYPYTPPARYTAFFSGGSHAPGLPPDYAPVLYDREIRYVDDQLDRFMKKLDSAGLLASTVFIVTSDHGEEFLEHGAIGHGAYLHPEALRVPLFFRGPGIEKGRRVADPVGLADLVPTILDLIGAPQPDVSMGRNLAPLLRGEVARVAEAPIYSEAWYETAMAAGGTTHKVEQPSIAVRQGRRKLVRLNRGGRFSYQYFDLGEDPDERVDLYPTRPGAVTDLRDLLASYEPLMSGIRRRCALSRARFGAVEVEPEQVEVDPAVEEKLRALGYVE